jgi:hypothetical protein
MIADAFRRNTTLQRHHFPSGKPHPPKNVPPYSLAFGVSSVFGRIASAALNSPKVWLT